jgi:hypothetical protein
LAASLVAVAHRRGRSDVGSTSTRLHHHGSGCQRRLA